MFLGPSVSLQSLALQAAGLRASLQFQPNVGTEGQRQQWFRSLEDSETLASSPVGGIKRFLLGEDWPLRRAKAMLDRVAAQSVFAGLFLADARSGFSSNMARFDSADRAVEKARVYVIRSRSIHRERPHERAVRLVRMLFESREPSSQTLTAMLDRAFEAHISKLDARVLTMPELVVYDDMPADVAYPRYFEDAHPHLMDYLHRTLIEINGGCDFDWDACRRETIGHLIELRVEGEGLAAKDAHDVHKRRGIALAAQLPEYSDFQLFSLLVQIRNGRPETALVEELKRARNGRIVDFDDAVGAGFTWRQLLKASELAGGIDIIHANIETACRMAEYEQPGVDPQIVRLQVRAAVARLGKETGSSRPEYDDAIRRLRALESDPAAGRVIRLSDRRS